MTSPTTVTWPQFQERLALLPAWQPEQTDVVVTDDEPAGVHSMRIWVLSDIHSEVVDWEPPSTPDADLCVLAGDTAGGGREAVEWAAWHVRPRMPVISVLGNHEFYRHVMARERSEAQFAGRRHDVQVLDNMVWTFPGTRFVGATLWTDYQLDGDPNRGMAIASVQMRDHSMILAGDGSSGRFTPRHARELHRESVSYLAEVLTQPFDGDTVVVTHHGPAPGSITDAYEGDELNPAFASNLTSLIERHQPALWIHGHTHSSRDYEIGATRVVCNPRGYGSENPAFDPALVIHLRKLRPRPPGM